MKRPYLNSGHYPALATRLLILLLASVLTLAACSKDDSAESIAKNDSGNNSLLSLVPANTPYLGGNLSPAPDAIIDAYYKRFEPAIAEMQSILSETRAELEANMAELEDDPAQRLLLSLLMELDGKLNRADIESLGLDLSAESVVYGISAFPVFRMGLGDAGVFRTTVQRVIERADVEAPMLEFQGLSYWRITPDQHYDNGNNPKISLYVAVLQDHLAMGVLPTEAEASVLPGFLALEKPTDSAAADTLRDINKRFDYSPYGSGVLDIQKLANEFLDPNSLVGQMLSQAGHDLSAEFNDQCRAELSSIIAHTPRLYAGMVEFSEYVIAQQFVLETESSLAQDLMALVSDIPHANTASGYLAELALGSGFALARLPAKQGHRSCRTTLPVREICPAERRARQATDQLNQPIPPMINNLLGIRAAISRLYPRPGPAGSPKA